MKIYLNLTGGYIKKNIDLNYVATESTIKKFNYQIYNPTLNNLFP